MALDSQSTESAKSNVQQKSFFKKPKWAAPTGSLTRSDFYRRADQTYIDIVTAKPVERQGSRGYPNTVEGDGDSGSESREVKRRRISDDTEEPRPSYLNSSTRDSALDHDSPGEPASDRPLAEKDCLQEPESASKHDSVSTPVKPINLSDTYKHTKTTTVIDLEGDLSESETSSVAGPSREEPRSELDDDLQLEEEFPELARKARQRAQQSMARLETRLPQDVDANGGSYKSPGSPIALSGASDGGVTHKEPIVRILITSNLKYTKPLIVQRKLSQRLRDVRMAWCRRQGFSDEMTATVFLTWKGTRLFDVTTCKSLGIQNAGDHNPLFAEDDVSGEHEEIQVHMEAATEETMDAQRREPAEGSIAPGDDNPSNDGENRIRLTLKSPGLDEFKLLVKPNTKISRIISTFQKARNISADKMIHLLFDGERLDAGSFVKDNDIADLDCIDAQVK